MLAVKKSPYPVKQEHVAVSVDHQRVVAERGRLCLLYNIKPRLQSEQKRI